MNEHINLDNETHKPLVNAMAHLNGNVRCKVADKLRWRLRMKNHHPTLTPMSPLERTIRQQLDSEGSGAHENP